MANQIFIALDCGKANTKVAVLNTKDGSVDISMIPTKLKEVEMNLDVSGISTHSMVYEGKKYGLGMADTISNLNTNSKLDDIHKMMALFVVAANVNSGDTVTVAVNCPYDVGIDVERKKEFQREFLPKGDVEVEVDGVTKKFYIASVKAFPEGISAMAYLGINLERPVGLIDIGGLNSTYTYFNETGVRVNDRSGLAKAGYLKHCEKNLGQINQALDTDFSIDEWVLSVSRGSVYGYEEESTEFIKAMLDQLLDTIVKTCEQKLWNFRTCDLIFVGGASYALKERILARYSKALIPENAMYCNVLGAMQFLCQTKGITFSGVVNK